MSAPKVDIQMNVTSGLNIVSEDEFPKCFQSLYKQCNKCSLSLWSYLEGTSHMPSLCAHKQVC